MSVVREEFGPTLPELLGARLRVAPRTIWRVVGAIGVVAVLVVIWLAFLRDMAREDAGCTAAIQRALAEAGPIADGVLRPKWVPADVGDEVVLFGASVDETRAFALQALERRLKVIGLTAVA